MQYFWRSTRLGECSSSHSSTQTCSLLWVESCYWHRQFSWSNLNFTHRIDVCVNVCKRRTSVVSSDIPTTFCRRQEIMLFIEKLTAQLEELYKDECNVIVLGDFNVDQIHGQYSYLLCFYPVFKLFYKYLWRNIRSCLPQ